jgi:hypothetical protein
MQGVHAVLSRTAAGSTMRKSTFSDAFISQNMSDSDEIAELVSMGRRGSDDPSRLCPSNDSAISTD